MVRINRFTSRAQAEMACAYLAAEGINARFSGDDAGGAYPQIPFSIGGTAVDVPADQVEEALRLLDGHEPEDGGEAGSPEPLRRWWRVRAVMVFVFVGMYVIPVLWGMFEALRW